MRPTQPHPGVAQAKRRNSATAWGEPYLNYAWLRRTWEVSGRAYVQMYSGINWNDDSGSWEVNRQWPLATQAGLQAYYVERPARGAVNMGFVCHDLSLLNELSELYLAYANRLTTLGEMRRRGQLESLSTRPLEGEGDDSARTLMWIEKRPEGSRMRECPLCNSQFFHTAARLIRFTTLLPETERTSSMNAFVRFYAPLIVRDHLIRQLYEASREYLGDRGVAYKRVQSWKVMVASTLRPKVSYQNAMSDLDVWLIAGAAEILGANANDPSLVPLKADEKARLQDAVRTGLALFQKEKTFYPDTKNFQGELVGSTSYFNGDWADWPNEAEYSGYTGCSFPTPKDKKYNPGTSWDVSHFHRIPVFVRSLYDNKTATRIDFPSTRDVLLLTNQLMYKVFKGNFNLPLFNNYFDGGNGWYRVGYGKATFGYPPAECCDSRNSDRPCLTDGAVQGWGLLAHFNPDLMELMHALGKLAARDDTTMKRFKDQYFWAFGQPYSFKNPQGQPQHPLLLFLVLSMVPEKLRGCGDQ